MKTELKKYFAVKLLRLSFWIMPKCKFKLQLAKLVNNHLLEGMDT